MICHGLYGNRDVAWSAVNSALLAVEADVVFYRLSSTNVWCMWSKHVRSLFSLPFSISHIRCSASLRPVTLSHRRRTPPNPLHHRSAPTSTPLVKDCKCETVLALPPLFHTHACPYRCTISLRWFRVSEMLLNSR